MKLEMQFIWFFGEPAFCAAKQQTKLNCSLQKFAAFKRTENWSQVHGWVINVSFKLSFYHFMWQKVLVEFLLYYGFYIFQLSSCNLSNILSFQLDLRQSTKNWFKKLSQRNSNFELDRQALTTLTRTQTYKIPPHIAEENKIVPNLNSKSKNWIWGWIPKHFQNFHLQA